MGQTHSTSNKRETGQNDEGHTKTDYYELLQVERNASGEEIKKAYRKKALELHPDRNFGNVEATTKLFAEIQSAYEVLSDPQERAWYDSHSNAFLGNDGGAETTDYSHNTRMTTSQDIFKLFSRFSPQMEFSDSPNGFYGGLCETFSQLALEEQMACRWDCIEIVEYPPFGSSIDDWEGVRQFYAAWSSFSTKKSFAWKDAYRYSEAPDRRVRRLMEKGNKRLREAAIRDFNEAVRSLVAFVKKRDPRYKCYRENQSQQQEAMRQSATAQATRSRAANQAKLRNHVTQDWAKSEEPGEIQSESSEGETEHFECIVCHKSFKSQNQYQAHERSKKHIKAVRQLCWEMRVEHEELNLRDEPPDGKDGVQGNLEHKTGATGSDDGVQYTGAESESDTEIDKSRYTRSTSDEAADPINTPSINTDESRRALKLDDGSDYAPRELLKNRLGPHASSAHEGETESTDELSRHLSTLRADDSEPASTTKKTGKAKQKRARKAHRAAEQSEGFACTVCEALFPSRNKLFSHVKSHGQAQFSRKK